MRRVPSPLRLLRADLAIPCSLGLLGVLVHLPWITRYGWFRDELYYLACARRLDWGYVDHPPLSIAILALVRAVAGVSLPALRLVPALAGGLAVFATGMATRELRGGPFAQALAALALLIAPLVLATTHVYSMNALDILFWALAAWILARWSRTRDEALWPMLGLVLGLALLNKASALWLGGGIALGLLATSRRRVLATPGPWLALAIAALFLVPHLAWQQRHGWPTLEFMRNATAHKMRDVTPADFLKGQVLGMHPATAPIWIAGLVAPWLVRRLEPSRTLPLVWLAVAALLFLAGRSRANYLAPAYPFLLAPGAVAIGGWLDGPRRPWRTAALALVAVLGAATVPLVLPVLPPERYVRVAAALHLAPRSEEHLEVGPLPQAFADMFGWEDLARKVAAVASELTPEERANAVIYARNYGEAAALELYAPRYHLPRVVCPHNNYWLWGPGPLEPRPLAMIILGGDRDDNARAMEWLGPRGTVGGRWSMPYERDQRVFLGRRPTVKLEAIWPSEKVFI